MKLCLAVATGLLVVLSANVTPTEASIVVAQGDKIDLYRGPGSLGGVFYVDVRDQGSSTGPLFDFSTFCVQLSENVEMSSGATSSTGTKRTYEVLFAPSKNTVVGGASLGSFAAWLYSEFLAGDIVATTNSQANTIQAGIWKSMGYVLPGSFSYNPTLLATYAADYLYDVTNDIWGMNPGGSVDANGNLGTFTGNIFIMNLGTRYTSGPHAGEIKTHNQDQLVYIPPPPSGNTPTVPEPVSFLVWSMLAMCVGSLTLRSRD